MLKNNFLGSFFSIILIVCLFSNRGQANDDYIAILPPLEDKVLTEAQKNLASEFNYYLQYSLHRSYKTHLVSRSQLSKIVFENKANILKQPKLRRFNVLPCQHILFSVYDGNEKIFRSFPIKNQQNSTSPPPIELNLHAGSDLKQSAEKMAEQIAQRLNLKKRAAETPEIGESQKQKISLVITSTRKSPETQYAVDILNQSIQEAIDKKAKYALLDREHLAKSMRELSLEYGISNDVISPANIQLADMILKPEVIKEKEKHFVLLYAIEPQTSSILNIIKCDLDELTTEIAINFIETTKSHQERLDENRLKDSQELRHTESTFYKNQIGKFLGLRMSMESQYRMNLMLLQASIGLIPDDSQKLLDTLHSTIHEVTRQKSDTPEANSEFENLFYLPISELKNVYNVDSTWTQAKYYVVTDQSQKALDVLRDPRAREYVANLYEIEAYALFDLERYKECSDLILRRSRFSNNAMRLAASALGKQGRFKEEQELLSRNAHAIGNSLDGILRMIKLTKEHEGSRACIKFWEKKAHEWERLKPEVLFAIAPCYVDTNNKDLAIDVYQSILLRYKKPSNPHYKRAKMELVKLGVDDVISPTDQSHTFNFAKSSSIEIILDSSYTLEEVKPTAQILADFWGVDVHLYPNAIDFTKSSAYDPLRKTIQATPLKMSLLHYPLAKSDKCIQRYYLTKLRMISRVKAYVGDLYMTHTYSSAVASSYYLYYYHRFYDKRPIPKQLAILFRGFTTLNEALAKKKMTPTLKIPPYLFSNNGSLIFSEYEMLLSRTDRENLGNLSRKDVIDAYANLERADSEWAMRNPLDQQDRDFIEKASRQYEDNQPTIIKPKKK